MAHARLALVRYGAGPVRRIPVWLSSVLAHADVALFRCGAVSLWRCFVVALFRCGAVSLWRCFVVAQFRRHVMVQFHAVPV